MKKLILSILFVLSTSIFAQEKVSYIVGLDVSNDYLLRGSDVYSSQLSKDQVFNLVPTLIPSFTINVGSSLFFNILNIDALSARTDLKDFDELDFTVGYIIDGKLGTIIPSFTELTFPQASQFNYTELAVTYTIPYEILNPSISWISSLGLSNNFNYVNVSISHKFEINNFTIVPKLSIGSFLDFIGDSTIVHSDLGFPVLYRISDNLEVHINLIGSYRILNYDNSYSPFTLTTTIGSSYSF